MHVASLLHWFEMKVVKRSYKSCGRLLPRNLWLGVNYVESPLPATACCPCPPCTPHISQLYLCITSPTSIICVCVSVCVFVRVCVCVRVFRSICLFKWASHTWVYSFLQIGLLAVCLCIFLQNQMKTCELI